MMKLGQITPFSFFDARGVALTNYSVGDEVLVSSRIPEGAVGTIKDNDTIFTTAGGSLDYYIRYASGGEAKFRAGISADDSGFINKLLKTGDRVVIKLAATGVGVIDAIWHGELKQIKEENPVTVADVSDFDEEEL